MSKDIDFNDLFKYLHGDIFWKRRLSNRVKIGDKIKTIGSHGYIIVGVLGVRMLAHRIIWEMHNGPIPDGMQIDHINHNKLDNRIENLRVVTSTENNHNLKMRKNNKPGITGVSWDKQHSKWAANIKVNGVFIRLGLFSCIKDAAKVRRKAELKYNFHENHGR